MPMKKFNSRRESSLYVIVLVENFFESKKYIPVGTGLEVNRTVHIRYNDSTCSISDLDQVESRGRGKRRAPRRPVDLDALSETVYDRYFDGGNVVCGDHPGWTSVLRFLE